LQKVLATCLNVQYNYLYDAGYIRSNLLLNFVITRRNLKKHPTITDNELHIEEKIDSIYGSKPLCDMRQSLKITMD